MEAEHSTDEPARKRSERARTRERGLARDHCPPQPSEESEHAEPDEEEQPVVRMRRARGDECRGRSERPEACDAIDAHEREGASHERERGDGRDAPEHGRDLGRRERIGLGRRERELAEQEHRGALDYGESEAQRFLRRIDVEARAMRSTAHHRVGDTPEHDDGAGRNEREEAPAERNRRAIDEERVRQEVAADCDGALPGEEREREEERGGDRGSARALHAAAVVKQQGEHAERRGDDRVAIRDPADREAVRVVDRVEERREPSDGAVARDAAIEERRGEDEQRVPRERVCVLRERAVRPESGIEPMGELAHGPQERDQELGVHPPGRVSGLDLPVIARGLAICDAEGRFVRVGERTARGALGQEEPMYVIVEVEAEEQRRSRQDDADEHEADREPRVRKQRDSGGSLSAHTLVPRFGFMEALASGITGGSGTGTMLTLLRRLSLRHLLASPLRSALVVVGIALGVAVLVAARATSDAMLRTFDELVERVAGRAELVVVGNESGIPGELTAEVSAVEGVAHAAATVEVTTRFADDSGPLLVLGVDFLGDAHFVPFEPTEGERAVVEDPLAFVNDPRAILVTRTLAKERGLAAGSEVAVLGANGRTTLRVWSVIEDSGPASSFGGQVAVMSLDAAQVTFARGTLVDRIDVALVPEADRDTVSERIRAAVAGAARVEGAQVVGERLRSLSEPLSRGLQLSGVVALLVAVFLIYNAIGVAVTQRRREIGIVRALGVGRRRVVVHLCLEATLLALVGIAVGLALASELVVYTFGQSREAIERVLAATPAAPRITARHALEGALAGIAIAWIAAYLPARRGAYADPVASLRPSSVLSPSTRIPFGALAVLGACATGAAWLLAGLATHTAGYLATVLNLGGAALLVPLVVVATRRALRRPVSALFGPPGRLALDYVQRNLGRSTVNVLALMVAVAMGVAVSGWLTSFERSIRAWFEQVAAADLTITAGSPVVDRRHLPLSPDALERLHGIAGVREAQPVRMIAQRHGATSFQLVASDTRAYLAQALRRNRTWKVLDGRAPIEPHELAEAPRIVLGENAAERLGLRAGDHLKLASAAGEVELEVRAVVVDYSSEIGAGFIDRGLYVEKWRDEAIDVVNLYLDDDADRALVVREVRRRLGGGDALFVTGTSELREQFLGLVHESFAYTRSLELIVLLIALMGVVGTLVAAVLDRVREIGVLRALGATRLQVARALVLEAAFLGLCASGWGAIAGAGQCALFLDTLVAQSSGWHLDFVFPIAGASRIAALVVATAALAGLVPGLRAARLEIRDALAHE